MYLGLVFQVAGLVGGCVLIFETMNFNVSRELLLIAIVGSGALLLVPGRYKVVEVGSTLMVAAFTLSTIVAMIALQWTPYRVSASQLLDGLKFQLPDSFNVAFAAFGVIGVGASELIYYPYWCLEKGYARSVGTRDGTPEWLARARGWLRIMRVDAWLSFVLYTSATVAFYLLGAAILHAKGLVVDDSRMIETLSQMYQSTFGPWSLGVFLTGAFAVLYSTVFGATASNARLFADGLSLFGLTTYATPQDHARAVRLGCVLLPVGSTAAFLLFGNPLSLVFVGALAQGLMLPFLALLALHCRFRHTEPALRPGRLWTFALCLAASCMIAAGVYQVAQQLRRVLF